MIDKQKLFSEIGQTLQALSPFYQEDITKLLQEADPPNSWFLLNSVRANEPEPFKIENMAQVGPFASMKQHVERLNELVETGFLKQANGGSFQLTEKGRGLIEGFFNAAHERLADIRPLPAEEMVQLKGLLARLVEATLAAPEPENKNAITASLWTTPGPESSDAAFIDQYVTDLIRFRDDAHLAAWKPYDVSGQAWESLTFIWQDQAGTAAELAEQLSFRGYAETNYAAALEELKGQGWIEASDGRYQLTEEGKRVRETAEAETDRIHFASWSALSEAELDQLQLLLERANEDLNKDGLEQLWSLARDVSQAIFPVTRSAVNPVFEKHFETPAAFRPTLMAIGNEPKPLAVDDYLRAAPYVNPDRATQLLMDATESGFLASGNGSGFKVTDSGREAMNEVNDVFYRYLGELDVLPEEDMDTLAGLLKQLVKNSLHADEPADKWAIVNMHNFHPKTEYAPLAKIDQYLDDLIAFRDDAHIASWQSYNISGRTWEALSFVWQGQASSAAELAEKLPFRGFDEAAYVQSLTELTEKGWVQETPEGFQVTEKGQSIRQEAEDTTNRYFFGPWTVLDHAQQTRLRRLLIRLKLGLQELAEEVQ